MAFETRETVYSESQRNWSPTSPTSRCGRQRSRDDAAWSVTLGDLDAGKLLLARGASVDSRFRGETRTGVHEQVAA